MRIELSKMGVGFKVILGVVVVAIPSIVLLQVNSNDKSVEMGDFNAPDNKAQVMMDSPGGTQIIQDGYRFVPVSNEKKQVIMRSLKEIRSEYPNQNITIKFGRWNSDQIARQIVDQLVPLITNAGLQVVEPQIFMGAPSRTRAGVSYPTSLTKVTESLLSALSPAIDGVSEKKVSDSSGGDVIFLYVEGEPKFENGGTANFK